MTCFFCQLRYIIPLNRDHDNRIEEFCNRRIDFSSNQANALRIGFEVLHQFENWDKYDKAMEAYQYIDEIVSEGKKNCLPAAFAVSTAFTVSGVALREQMTAIHLSSNSFGVACTNSLLV